MKEELSKMDTTTVADTDKKLEKPPVTPSEQELPIVEDDGVLLVVIAAYTDFLTLTTNP